ncbi:MAG: hypothetical protein RLZZ59_516 [Pseudomonadota bacterium]|jgi:heme exporter protein A
MLSCISIGHDSNNCNIFSDISFTALPGAVVKITGKNGAGKTTFLRILSGIITPKYGEIFFKPGSDLHYVGHNLGIKDDFTVLEQLVFWSDLFGTRILIPAAAKYTELECLFDEACYKLSAGQRQKLAIAKLLLSGSNIWILDEIDSSLDEDNIILLKNLIASKANNKGIIIFSSHRDLIPYSFKIDI